MFMVTEYALIVILLNEHKCRKENSVTAAKSNLCIAVLGDKLSYSYAKTLPPETQMTGRYVGGHPIKQYLVQFEEIGSVHNKKRTGRPSTDAGTV
jgi:hypothetical protein